jgi:DNA-binding winged helix-turn-helix (wHTH) protein
MQPSLRPPIQLRFGPFEADLRAAELRKGDQKVPLQDQPFKVLTLLVQRPGELVTREELRGRSGRAIGLETSMKA